MVKMKEYRVLPLLAVLCLMFSGIHRMEVQAQEDSADLVFIIDGSNNVGRTGFNTIRDFLVNYVERRLEVGRSRMQVGMVQFSDDVKIEFTLDEYTSKRDLIDAMKKLQFSGGEESNLGAAIEYVVEQLFSAAGGSRRDEGVPQSLVVITAGPVSDDLREAANALKLNSIITFGIGVERADVSELQQITTDDSFVFTAPQFRGISQLENQIIPYIAGVAQRTIVLQPPTIITEVTEVNKRDIVFLIDSSSDLGGPAYSAIREFIVKLVNRLEIGSDLIRVGLAQYARDVKPEFYLNTFVAKKDVIAHLKKMRILNTSPLNTGAALSNIQRNFFTSSAGSRVDEGIPQLLVVITGGRSTDDISQASQNMKRAGVLTFSIGAKNAEESELQEIAFDSSLVFKPAEFKQVPLQALLPQVLAPLRTLTGVITEGPTEVLNQRDIVFLLDGSVNVGSSNFPLVRDFLINVINNLGVSSEGTRVGLAQFSDTPRTEFYLNTLTSKSDLIDRLGQLRIKGGNVLNIGSALQFVIRNHFTRSAGSRIEEKIPQLLVVLAAGKSSDNVQAVANDLTRSGVLTFCIGLGDANKEELEAIAFNPTLVYEIDDFSSLPAFSQQLVTPITTYVRGEVTEVTVISADEDNKKDIVFLIDGSDSAISGFSSLMSFIQRVVEYLNVGQDKVRIAVVQYSNSARPVFLLNAYSDQQDVIRAIQSISPMGGSPLNTGAALDYVARNVLTQSAGSRAEDGVPQFLVLLTTGKSRDDVRRPATSLKASGVVPYAIGTGSADRTELQSISLTPDFVLYFPDVSELENAYQTFSQRVKTITTSDISTITRTVTTETESKRDILFLIDGSTNIAGRFPVVRDFVANIIDGLNVSPDGTRISLGLVGENVKVEFKFDSFQTKAEVVSAVRKLRFRPSKEFNLGVALEYAHGNLFTPESGSRIREGVQQYLVLLAAGKSGDSVDQAANQLKRAGVVTFAIKAQRAESEELEKIVLAPQFIVSSENLGDLSNLQSQFVNLIKTISVEVPTETYDINKRKDIVFLVDGSNDGRSSFPSLRSFIQKVVESLDVGQDKTRIGVVQYSDATRPSFLLNSYLDSQGVVGAVQQLTPIGGSPLNTGAALDYVTTNVFTRAAGSRSAEGVPQFLILLTTARSRDDVRRPATELKSSGVIPFAIGVRNADTDELRTISFIPDFAVSVPDVSQLSSVYQTFKTRVSELKASDIEVLRRSVPSVTYQGGKRDVVFLVDGSRGATPEFNNVKALIERIVATMDVSPDTTRVAVVQYSDDPRVEFLLNAHSTKEEVQSAVKRIRPKGGSSVNTGNALEYVSKNIFTRPSGSRIEEQVPQFLIVTSSGPSADDVEEGAKTVKDSSVVPFLIGKNIDNEEASKITFGQDFIYSVSSFQDIPSMEQKLISSVSSLDREKITQIILQQSGSAAAPDPDRRDVVFLVDGSTRTGSDGIANIRDLILKVVQSFDIGPNKVRVGLVQFSNNPVTEFLLRANMNKPALIQSIRRLRHRGGDPLNIGKALDFAAKNHFITSAGSRIEEGVPQFLVLLTGGKSEDDVASGARLLGTNRIRSLAVASGSADRDEVSRIVSDPRYLLTVREFKDLPNIENTLLRSFIRPVDPTLPPTPSEPTGTGKKEADIVFLVDGSMNLGRDNFKEVLQFVSGIVDAVVEEDDAIRIGLAQFNSDVTDEFFLKEYKDRDEIMDAVTKAEYKGGRVASLGTAIRHLQDKHFVKAAGSRIDTGVPQIAFIVTGAKTVSDGQAVAQALASKGVKIFAIGVGSIGADEVSKIASDAPSAFRVPIVQELSELNEQILITLDTALQKRSVCPGVVEAVKDCNLEVIIGFDVDVSSGQNIFNTYRGLEPKLRQILERISNMQKISCSGDKKPTVKVAILSQGRTGPVEAFDFSDYRPELAEKIIAMGTRGPYVLTSQTLQTYLKKFKTSGDDNSLKVVIHITDGVDASMAELQQASASLQNAGVKALLFVGIESAPRFDQIMQLEFGRGFTYNNPLRLNRVDLDYEIIEELDNVAEKGCCGVSCKCSGERGDVGPPGIAGPKGSTGPKGHQGFPGEEGGPGERGPPGTNGTQGFRGCPGQRGFKGSRGFSGDKGEVGEIGLDGIDGEDGKRGTPGSSGERGSAGPRGEKGQKGYRGERGDQGLRGDPGEPGTDVTQRGPRGPKGESGSVGEPGRDGPAGQAGGAGKTGGIGRRGSPGLKGNRGGAGASGGVGEQGLRGSQGPPGQTGAPGTRGEQGLPGPRGPGGTPGPAGDRGRLGQLGRKGEPGDIGVKGSDGPVGPRGETGDDGRDGVGKPGLKGKKGETGFPGYPGVKGEPGDRGPNGDTGPKGGRGRRGNAGNPGTLGAPGDPGYPGQAGLKGPTDGQRDHCGLVKHIKNTCPCCYGPKECPVYPTDLVFAIDTSADVNRNQFNNMKDAVLRMVDQLTITDSNCPRGARVALLTYNNEVTTEVRFSEGLRKPALLKVIEDLQLKTNSKQRSLDTVMSFVARNTFKRARGGFLTRKVAVFFSNAPTRGSVQLNEAVLKLYDAGVAPVFLTSRDDRALGNALKVNNTDVGKAFVLGTGAQVNETIRRVFSCHVCLDICEPPSECGIVPGGNLRSRRSAVNDVDIDLAFLVDSSDSTNPSQFAEIKKFVSHVIEQLELSSEPKSSSHHARIAVLQHAPYDHQTNASFPPVKVDVGLTDYTEKEKLQAFIQTKMTQLYGSRALSNAIKYVVNHIFESAPSPRSTKVIFLILTGEVKSHELKQLRETIIEAKCKGYFFVILSIGKKVNSAQLNSLSSEPHDVFFKKADKASELHEETLMRFGLHLPGFVSSENAFHLSPEIQKHCDWFQNDRPASTSRDSTVNDEATNTIIPDEVLTSRKPEVVQSTARASTQTPRDRTVTTQMTTLPRTELLVSDVTESSVHLSWTNADPQQSHDYELSLTSLDDNTLVLKQNVTGTDRLIGGLMSGQLYQVTITGQHKTLGLITYQATFTTSKSQPPPEVLEHAEKIMNTEPLDTPEIDPCELDLDMGTQCKENEVKWFFDKTNKICTKVWYGGCGGNANKFDTEAECINRCQKTTVEKTMQLPTLESKVLAVGPEVCKLLKEEGTCREFILRWYYDSETKSCARFWYGGCGGNENRFNTQKDCEKICSSAPLNPSVSLNPSTTESAIGT